MDIKPVLKYLKKNVKKLQWFYNCYGSTIYGNETKDWPVNTYINGMRIELRPASENMRNIKPDFGNLEISIYNTMGVQIFYESDLEWNYPHSLMKAISEQIRKNPTYTRESISEIFKTEKRKIK